jgi:TolA-binding protein
VQEQTVADVRGRSGGAEPPDPGAARRLVQTGPGSGLPRDPATALARLDQLEAELRRLTNRTEVLTNDLNRIVAEASNRVGDLEFRLTELEGGDVSLLGPPEPLGGGLTAGRRAARAGGRASGGRGGAGGGRARGLRRRAGRGRGRGARAGGGAVRDLSRHVPRRAAVLGGAVPQGRGAGGRGRPARRGAQLPRRLQRDARRAFRAGRAAAPRGEPVADRADGGGLPDADGGGDALSRLPGGGAGSRGAAAMRCP